MSAEAVESICSDANWQKLIAGSTDCAPLGVASLAVCEPNSAYATGASCATVAGDDGLGASFNWKEAAAPCRSNDTVCLGAGEDGDVLGGSTARLPVIDGDSLDRDRFNIDNDGLDILPSKSERADSGRSGTESLHAARERGGTVTERPFNCDLFGDAWAGMGSTLPGFGPTTPAQRVPGTGLKRPLRKVTPRGLRLRAQVAQATAAENRAAVAENVVRETLEARALRVEALCHDLETGLERAKWEQLGRVDRLRADCTASLAAVRHEMSERSVAQRRDADEQIRRMTEEHKSTMNHMRREQDRISLNFADNLKETLLLNRRLPGKRKEHNAVLRRRIREQGFAVTSSPSPSRTGEGPGDGHPVSLERPQGDVEPTELLA